MKEKNIISFEYNKNKIILFLIISFSMIAFFLFVIFNSETLALMKPSTTAKYRVIGELFYGNKNLIKSFSALVLILFIYLSCLLSKMLIRKQMIFKNQNGFLYQNETLIVEISRIESLQLKERNNNNFIYVNIKDVNQFIKNESNLLRRIKYMLFNYTEKTPLILNLNYIKNEPLNIVEELLKLINK